MPDSNSTRAIVIVVVAIGLVMLLVLVGSLVMYSWAYSDRINQGVSALGVDLGGDTQVVARARLSERFERYAATPLTLRYAESEWKVTPSEMGLRFDAARTVASAFEIGREGNPVQRFLYQVTMWRTGQVPVQAFVTIEQGQRDAFFVRLARQIDQPSIDARLIIQPDLKVRVAPSQVGRRLESPRLATALERAFMNLSSGGIDVPVQETQPRISESAVQEAKNATEKMLSAPLSLSHEGHNWSLQPKGLQAWVEFVEQKDAQNKARMTASLSSEKLKSFLAQASREIDRKAQNARFSYSGGALRLLREGVDGRHLDVDAAVGLIQSQAVSDKRVVSLPVSTTRPAVSSADVNRLVIKERIDTASTSYAGSIPERKNNVEMAAKRLNGVVIAPGEIFSFNDELGPATLEAGFKTAWGIQVRDGNVRTVPAEAGGICQVATTLFQPVFWSGYQLEERYWHLYWIPKYGQQPKGLKGLDATVDAPYVDFKFKNNTSNPLLIQTSADGTNLTFSLYGIKPTWVVKVEPPKIENVVKTITDTVKEEDPNMPVGQSLWIEEAQDGFKSTIVRTVTENDDVRVLRLISEYKPSRNVIRVGAKAVPGQEPKPDQKPEQRPQATPQAPPAPQTTPAPQTVPRPQPTPTAQPKPQPPATPRPQATPTPRR